MPYSHRHESTPTELSSLISGVHGRERRHERDIQKIDLKRARRYGMAEYQLNGRIKYTYGGIVFIYCPRTNREVTSFPAPDQALETSGTKCVKPILLQKRHDCEDADVVSRHEETRSQVIRSLTSWKSYSVLVVDMSGSMRRDDLNGARCRSDGIWLALARDFIQQQLEQKTASKLDLVSVVVMKETAEVVMILEPIDWVLYNKLVDLREWQHLRPSGPGNYMPALEAAERLLSFNQHSSCSLSLLFFSDGRPSDKGNFSQKVGKIASQYGRRLSVCCIGMADDQNDAFTTLMDMVSEASAYGAISSFNKPSMHADSLSNIITSLCTTLTGSKTEMTDMKTGLAKKVRNDVRRERRGTPDDVALTNEWVAYRNSDEKHYVRRVWSWSYEANDFQYLRDNRCIICFSTVDPDSTHAAGLDCPHCHACNICLSCCESGHFEKHYKSKECYSWLKDLRTGRLVDKEIVSFAVAMKKPIFDEGAERMVHKFRFLNDHDEFVGPKMVAKQSRFVELEGSYRERMNYHKEFLRTQALASRFADYFNEAISDLVHHFDSAHHGWIASMPRIEFLEPLVVEVVRDDGTELNILIETQLEGDYVKFNNNMGYVKGQKSSSGNGNNMADLIGSFNQLDLDFERPGAGGVGELGAIEEGSEEEDESDDEQEGVIFDAKASAPDRGVYNEVHPSHFPQAFSHYTYEKSKRKLMVVDLQGVFETFDNDTSRYLLTDPVIHKRKRGRQKQLVNWTFGRTDRGEKGMKAFFETHECNEVCRLLGLHEKP